MRGKDKSYICIVVCIALLLGICIGWMFGRGQVVSAKTPNNSNREKYFTSVFIEKGDTIWKIARENITQEYSSMKEYIKEIKQCNNLYSNEITEGCYLLIPYYAEQPRQDKIPEM